MRTIFMNKLHLTAASVKWLWCTEYSSSSFQKLLQSTQFKYHTQQHLIRACSARHKQWGSTYANEKSAWKYFAWEFSVWVSECVSTAHNNLSYHSRLYLNFSLALVHCIRLSRPCQPLLVWCVCNSLNIQSSVQGSNFLKSAMPFKIECEK